MSGSVIAEGNTGRRGEILSRSYSGEIVGNIGRQTPRIITEDSFRPARIRHRLYRVVGIKCRNRTSPLGAERKADAVGRIAEAGRRSGRGDGRLAECQRQ